MNQIFVDTQPTFEPPGYPKEVGKIGEVLFDDQKLRGVLLAWIMFGEPQKPLLNEDDVRDYLNQVPEWLEPLKTDDPRPH